MTTNFFYSFLTTFRESLEALAVVAIVLMLLRERVKNPRKGYLCISIAVSIGLSFAILEGILFNYLNTNFGDNKYFKFFSILVVTLAVIALLMIMLFNSKNIYKKIKQKIAASTAILLTVSLISGFAVFWEGTEVVMFTFDDTNILGILIGGLLAVLISATFFFSTRKVTPGKLFNVLFVFLVFATSPFIIKLIDKTANLAGLDLDGVPQIYKINYKDNFGAELLYSLARGFFGIKSSLNIVTMIAQLTWIIGFLSTIIIVKKRHSKSKSKNVINVA